MTQKIAAAAVLIAILLGAPGSFAEDTAPAKASTGVDTKKPVDIEADQMEIRDKDKQATFTGNVVAKRSDVTLTSETLTVDYGDTKQADGSTGNEITHLDAKGNVVIVTAKQRITGAWAKLNPKTNVLEVGVGVTLTQGDTTLHGERLVTNTETGKTELSGGRVKGSFLPK